MHRASTATRSGAYRLPVERGGTGEPGAAQPGAAAVLARAAWWICVAVARWIGAYPVLVLTLVLGALAATGMTAVSAEIYEAVAEADGVAVLDAPVLELAVRARTPWLNSAVGAFTDLGGSVLLPVLAAVVAAALAVRRRQWTPVVLMAVAGAGSLLMTVVGKLLVGRIRPPLSAAVEPYETTASFPSGHSLNTVVLAGVAAYLLVTVRRRWISQLLAVGAAAAFAVAMGLSRVFLGYHWLTDVLVAWTLGVAWLSMVIIAHRLYLAVRPPGPGRRARRPAAGGGPGPIRRSGATSAIRPWRRS